MSAFFLREALFAQPRTATTAHSSRSLVFTFSSQLLHDSVSSEGALSPSVGTRPSSTSVGLGSSLCFCLTTLVRAPLRLCRMLSSTLGRGRGGSGRSCDARGHAGSTCRRLAASFASRIDGLGGGVGEKADRATRCGTASVGRIARAAAARFTPCADSGGNDAETAAGSATSATVPTTIAAARAERGCH